MIIDPFISFVPREDLMKAMSGFSAQIDGWVFPLLECRQGLTWFILSTRETIASKTTWAWLYEPRVIRKPTINLNERLKSQIILSVEPTSLTFQGYIERKTIARDYMGVQTIEIHGYIVKFH